MIDTDHNRGSSFGMNSTFERDNNKRLRGGSISGRLRTASDLEEWGWIDKSQKGILKDLLISGNTDLQGALDKFRGGDPTVLQELINQGIFKRHHSIDLLDGIDFDFLNVDQKNEFGNAFGDDISDDSFDAHYQDATMSSSMGIETVGVGISDLNQLLSNEEDCIALGNNILANLNETTFGNEWYDRNFAHSNFNNMNTLNNGVSSSSSNMHIRKNSLLAGDLKDWGNLEYSDGTTVQPSEIFDNDVDVDLSMYEHLAANLQKTNPSKLGRKSNTKASKESANNNTSTPISSSIQKTKLTKSQQAAADASLTPNSLNNGTTPILTKKEEKAANKLLSAAAATATSSSSSFAGMTKSTGGTTSLQHQLLSQNKDHESPTNNNNNNSSSNNTNNNNNSLVSPDNCLATTNKMSFGNDLNSNNNSNVFKGYNNININNSNNSMLTNSNNSNNNSQLPSTSMSSSSMSSNINSSSTYPTSTSTSSYSSASVLLLSANGLLPTPGISGPGLDGTENGLNNMLRSPDFIGAYDPEARRTRIERFIEKRNRRVWTKKVKYDVRKNFADSRLRVKGRFVKKEDEELMRELLTI